MTNLDYPFNIYRELTGNDYFHFGLWEEGTVSIEQAQDNLAELVMGMMPDGNVNVLEIGCGLGKFAAQLAERGHRVTGIDSDREKVRYATEKYSGGHTTFLEGDFFTHAEKLGESRFDVIILFESSQYFPDLKTLFAKCRTLLSDKGVVILCDEIIRSPELKSKTSVKLFDAYLSAFYENGFKITAHRDISRKVLPTSRYMVQNLSRLSGHKGVRALSEGWAFQKDMYENGLFGYVVLKAVKDTFFLEKYAENAEREIVPVFNEVFGVNRSMSHWIWKYRDNPFGKEAVVVVRDQHHALVGHYSGCYMPWFSQMDNRTHNVIQGVDTFTAKHVRRVGLGKTGLFARMGKYFFAHFCNYRMPFAYGVNTASAHELGRRYLDYRPIEPVGYYRSSMNRMPMRGLLTRLLLKRYRVEEIQSFGQEFDQLFHSAVKDFPTLIVKRDSKYLNWRYADPDRTYKKAGVFRGGNLVGYGIGSMEGKILTIGDLFVKKNHCNALGCLFEFFQNRWRPDSIDLWISARPTWLKERIETLGFKRQDPPFGLTMIYINLSDAYNDDTMHHLYYTKADTDLF